MRHFRAEGDDKYLDEDPKVPYQQKLSYSLKAITRLLPFVEFTVNYGFAIQNVWVTMLMITHKTPSQVDSFVWITPIVIAILVRPYIVRYVHSFSYKVYREISMVSLFMIVGAVGCLLVGESCELSKKTQITRRIVECTIGWTLMDLAFQFCQFFSEKIEESCKELNQIHEEEAKEKLEGKQGIEEERLEGVNKKENFQFYGLFLGYVVSLLICWIIHGKTVKEFYKCCKYAYWTVAGLSLITGIRLYIESRLNLPQRHVFESEREDQKGKLTISWQLSYYLPGLQELLGSDITNLILLLLHFVVVFLNDVVVIYATMWFSQPASVQYNKHGEALIAGLEYGSLTLLVYTILDNLKIKKKILSSVGYFQLALGLVFLVSLYSFFAYNYLSFALVAVSVGVLNQFYRHTVYNIEYDENPIFERCIQIVERAEKIFVLAVMPPIVMLGLGRDDIPDCLAWSAGMTVLGLVCYYFAKKRDREVENVKKTEQQTKKVNKIE